MKTFAPKSLHGSDLRGLMADLGATPKDVAAFLRVTERSVWRWLADDSAPFAVLSALWHESSEGRYAVALDVGNEVSILRGLRGALESERDRAVARLARLLAISETGAANDALIDGPAGGGGRRPVAPAINLVPDARRSVDGPRLPRLRPALRVRAGVRGRPGWLRRQTLQTLRR